MWQGVAMPTPAPLPAPFHAGAFSTTVALRAGVRHDRMRRRDLARPFHGVRAAGPGGFLDRCAAAQTRFDTRHFFSHTTAARVLRLPVREEDVHSDDLHVAVIPPFRAPKGTGIVGHQVRVESETLRDWNGLRIPSPVEVWCELASLLPIDVLVQAGDALLRRTDPLARADDLRAAVASAHGRPGVDRMREALALIRQRTDSPMETTIRLAIVRAGLPEPSINAALADSAGAFVAFGDLVYERAGIVIEYDGEHHRTDPAQYAADVDRLWRIEQLGWRVIRLNRTHLHGGAAEAVRRVRAALASRAG